MEGGTYKSNSRRDRILLFLNGVTAGVKDPIFGRDTGFYLFVLPVYDMIQSSLLVLVIIALITSTIAIFVKRGSRGVELKQFDQADIKEIGGFGSVYLSVAGLFFVLAWGKYLDRFHVMYSALGIVTGLGWTNANVRLPLYAVVIFLTLLAVSYAST